MALGGINKRLGELGITIPKPTSAIANYSPCTQAGNLLFISGHVSQEDDQIVTGKVGDDLDANRGYQLARLIALDILGTVNGYLGDLDRVSRIVKVTGMIRCTDTFTDHPLVMNGATDLLVEVFGEAGKPSRSAMGVAQLPKGAAIEIEAIVEVLP